MAQVVVLEGSLVSIMVGNSLHAKERKSPEAGCVLRHVSEPGPQPLFAFPGSHFLAGGVTLHLVSLELAKGKITAVRMREVEPADRGTRMHGLGLSQGYSGGRACLEEIK